MKIGIGTASPAFLLDVNGAVRFGMGDGMPSVHIGFETNVVGIGLNRNVNTGTIFDSSFGAHQLHNESGILQFEVYNSAGNVVTDKALIIDNSGNVGIGTTAPSHPLHMGSGAHVTAAGVWTDASSREYKENMRDLSVNEAMATLVNLRPSRFNYKVDKDDE